MKLCVQGNLMHLRRDSWPFSLSITEEETRIPIKASGSPEKRISEV